MSNLKFRLFLLLKLPLAFIAGLRLKAYAVTGVKISIKHRWINQNPFRSMYFAAEAMAAEATTGLIVFEALRKAKKNSSMLIIEQKATFSKKATGEITFLCADFEKVSRIIEIADKSGEANSVWLTSVGIDEQGDQVAEFQFLWSVKQRN